MDTHLDKLAVDLAKPGKLDEYIVLLGNLKDQLIKIMMKTLIEPRSYSKQEGTIVEFMGNLSIIMFSTILETLIKRPVECTKMQLVNFTSAYTRYKEFLSIFKIFNECYSALLAKDEGKTGHSTQLNRDNLSKLMDLASIAKKDPSS
jgi:hypothetical protein